MKVAGEIAGMYYRYRPFQKDTFTTEGDLLSCGSVNPRLYRNSSEPYPRAISVSNMPATSFNQKP